MDVATASASRSQPVHCGAKRKKEKKKIEMSPNFLLLLIAAFIVSSRAFGNGGSQAARSIVVSERMQLAL